jgi:hypothetical protein
MKGSEAGSESGSWRSKTYGSGFESGTIVYSSRKLTWGSELSTTPHLLLVHGHGVGEGSVDRG